MPITRRICCAILLTWLFAPRAMFAEPAAPVQLRPSAPVARGIEAFPRLVAAPGDQAAQRINQALARRDAKIREAVKDCHAQDKAGEWQRSISVSMRGPHYLSLIARDNWNCGGAHPDNGAMALVYDLRTGTPVDWKRLTPAGLLQEASTDTAGDGTTIGVVKSNALSALLMKSLVAQKIDGDCRDYLADTSLTFMLWPDAGANGITVEPSNVIHAMAACGESVTISVPDSRALGIDAAMLDDVEEAHRRGWFDRDKP
jgi:hypothetical protein